MRVSAKGEYGELLQRRRNFLVVATRGLYGARVSFTGAMTDLAARNVVLAGRREASVYRFVELGELRLVAGAAALGARVVAGRAGRKVLPGN